MHGVGYRGDGMEKNDCSGFGFSSQVWLVSDLVSCCMITNFSEESKYRVFENKILRKTYGALQNIKNGESQI